MNFSVTRPELSDAPAIADLHVAAWRETYAHLLPPGYFSDAHLRMRQEMWSYILGNPRDEWSVRIANSDGQLVGFAMAGPSFGPAGQDLPRDRQLYSLYVTAAHHGTGVGQSLLDQTLGSGAAMLWVAKQNPRAIAFYRRNRFELDGVEQVDPSAPNITDARMVR